MKLKDRIWLWGQDAGTHHAYHNNEWKLPGVNRMDPAAGAGYFGIVNCCRVVMSGKPEPPFDAESEKLKGLKRLVWSVVGDGSTDRTYGGVTDIEEVLRQAQKFPNVCGGILDDFFFDNAPPRLTVEQLKEVKERLGANKPRPLDLWIVLYDRQLGLDCNSYLDICDVITFWTWIGANLKNIDDNLGKLCLKTPGKRRMAGCYLWNYGESKPMTVEQTEYQINKYHQWIKKGGLDGIIVVSNNLADIGLESSKWLKGWLSRTGDEET